MSASRQLAAIMFTDIFSYTALMGEDEHKAFDLLRKNRHIFALQDDICSKIAGHLKLTLLENRETGADNQPTRNLHIERSSGFFCILGSYTLRQSVCGSRRLLYNLTNSPIFRCR
jgi:hypothetical protein